MQRRFDVAIVGGGIGGSALASRLASSGLDVVLMEQQGQYRDRVRGETIVPWGVRELVALGLEQVLIDAGGGYADRFVPYDETLAPAEAESLVMPYSLVAQDVRGQLNVGHPQAAAALSAEAGRVGAHVVRGVTDVKIAAGPSPSITWSDAGTEEEATCRIVVGADGRGSSIRRQIGISVEERRAETYGAGLLVRADSGFDANTMGTAGNALFFAFPRPGGFARLYLLVDIDRQTEFSGPGRLEAFLSNYTNDAFPASGALVAGEVAGPCGGAPMTDSWTTKPPVVEGVVLIGDAAGWNDPIIGQGLSIALRDARSVADVLTASSDWSAGAFGGYVEERSERMRRLAISAHITTAMRCRHTPEWRQRRRRWQEAIGMDPVVMMQAAAGLAGPELAPAEAFSEESVTRTLNL